VHIDGDIFYSINNITKRIWKALHHWVLHVSLYLHM